MSNLLRMFGWVDSYHRSYRDAVSESRRLRAGPDAADFIVRIEPAPYGGYRVRSMLAEFYVDQLANGLVPGRVARYPSRSAA